jgi:uncharacterized membrane protein YqjE
MSMISFTFTHTTYLITLNHTSTDLYVNNPNIDNDAIHALTLLPELYFLSIVGTSIGMAGLHNFVIITHWPAHRLVTMEIPSSCAVVPSETKMINIWDLDIVHKMPCAQ